MAKRKVGIIGHFGGNENITDGQTVKTKILYSELKQATDWDISVVDTYYKKKNPIKLVLDSVRCLLKNRDVIVSLSGNGMRLYFPILSFLARYINIRVYHDVIGGNLDSYVRKIPSFKKYLNSFRVNWVETRGLKERLTELGVNNCTVLPNFKRLTILDREKQETLQKPYRFCTFSRVIKEKGIEDAIAAIEKMNREQGDDYCLLDIYGLVDEEYKETFNRLLSKSSEAIHYKGVVQYDKSVAVLKTYHALLFPTFWEGEGFPGTIIDAFSAGLPVVATDWNANAEIIQDGYTGVVYPNTYAKNLVEAIYWLIDNEERFHIMQKNCVTEAQKYKPDRNIQIIKELIEL